MRTLLLIIAILFIGCQTTTTATYLGVGSLNKAGTTIEIVWKEPAYEFGERIARDPLMIEAQRQDGLQYCNEWGYTEIRFLPVIREQCSRFSTGFFKSTYCSVYTITQTMVCS